MAPIKSSYLPLGIHQGFCDHYLNDPSILDTLETLMGESFLLFASNAARYPENTRWFKPSIGANKACSGYVLLGCGPFFM